MLMLSGSTPGQLDHDRELVRVVGVVAVDVRAEAAAQPGEARHLPEVGEELLDLLVQLVDVARCVIGAERYPRSASVAAHEHAGRGSCCGTRWVLRHRVAVVVAWASCSARRLGELAALAAALEHVHRSRHRLRARADGARGALRRPAATARSPSSSRCRTRATRALVARLQRVVDRAAHGRADAAARRRCSSPARTSSTATSSRRSTSPTRRATSDDLLARGRAAAGRRARLRHRRRVDPARPRPDLQRGPEEGRVDRAPDRARSCCCSCSGSRPSVTIPFIFAACTIMGTLGIVYGIAHLADDADVRRRTSSS